MTNGPGMGEVADLLANLPDGLTAREVDIAMTAANTQNAVMSLMLACFRAAGADEAMVDRALGLLVAALEEAMGGG